jgi:multiple antibiotic resistance protein
MPSSFVYDVLKASLALFIIVDPIGNVPIFIGLTKDMKPKQRDNAMHTAIIVAFAILVIFAIIGQQVLGIFDISLYSFMIAGGILLLIVATKILTTGRWEETTSPESVGAVPIAFPLLVGPGAITAAIVDLETLGMAVTLAAIFVTLVATWIILHSIEYIHRVLGKSGSAVVARLMAIFIAAIAIGFIVKGITNSFSIP